MTARAVVTLFFTVYIHSSLVINFAERTGGGKTTRESSCSRADVWPSCFFHVLSHFGYRLDTISFSLEQYGCSESCFVRIQKCVNARCWIVLNLFLFELLSSCFSKRSFVGEVAQNAPTVVGLLNALPRASPGESAAAGSRALPITILTAASTGNSDDGVLLECTVTNKQMGKFGLFGPNGTSSNKALVVTVRRVV